MADARVPADPAERRRFLQDFVRQHPRQMTLKLAADLGVPEADIVRAFPDNRAVELDVKNWQAIVEALEPLGAVHVIVSNGATTLEAVGQFGNFSKTGEFFNVQTGSLDMHLRWQQLGAIFAVEKPGHLDGQPTLSIQFFDVGGAAAFKVFFNFGEAATPERLQAFQKIREQFK